jgi:hypothetical protein
MFRRPENGVDFIAGPTDPETPHRNASRTVCPSTMSRLERFWRLFSSIRHKLPNSPILAVVSGEQERLRAFGECLTNLNLSRSSIIG